MNQGILRGSALPRVKGMHHQKAVLSTLNDNRRALRSGNYKQQHDTIDPAWAVAFHAAWQDFQLQGQIWALVSLLLHKGQVSVRLAQWEGAALAQPLYTFSRKTSSIVPWPNKIRRNDQ